MAYLFNFSIVSAGQPALQAFLKCNFEVFLHLDGGHNCVLLSLEIRVHLKLNTGLQKIVNFDIGSKIDITYFICLVKPKLNW